MECPVAARPGGSRLLPGAARPENGFTHVSKDETDTKTSNPLVIPRSRHCISRRDISPEALKVLYRLHRLGFKAYLVGGGVRDLLLKRKPKDFDVATDARPNRLRKVFRNCRVIGRRFRLVHVLFRGGKRIEVSTFRRSSDFALKQENGLILRDNTFGTPEEDARRRDLTINGLFYDISNFSVLDYVGGVRDLEKRIVRTISQPDESFREDPVRMIRALRHTARLDFTIETETYEAILRQKELISFSNPSRLTEEIFKDLRGGASAKFFRLLARTGLLNYIFPELARQTTRNPEHDLWRRLEVMDEFVAAGREYPNTVLATVLLLSVLLPEGVRASRSRKEGVDIGKAVIQRLRTLRTHFRLSLQASNRVVQIIMAHRRLSASPPKKELPKSLLGKSYLPEALLFHEIVEKAEGRPFEGVDRFLRQAENALKTRSRPTSRGMSSRKGPQERPRRGGKKRRRSSRKRR